jgi:uncharacterized integral membrane protein
MPNGGVTGGSQRSGVTLGTIASVGGAALLLIFVLQNTESVRVHFLFWHFTWPIWVLILVAAAAGALIWIGLGVLRRHRRRVDRRQDRRG